MNHTNPFFTPQDNLPSGADDRNYPVSKEPVDYLTPREEEQVGLRLNNEYKPIKKDNDDIII